MASLITPELKAPPEAIAVEVDFYDDAEKKAFLISPLTAQLRDVPVTLSLPTTDLCAYYLYYKRRVGIDGYSSHEDMVAQWAKALVEFDGLIQFENSSISLISANNMNSATTERIGESIGLSVVSHLHGMHQADWSRIPVTNTRKTFDFERTWTASDGKKFVQVETKGSATTDNKKKTSSVSQHKSDIKKKKLASQKQKNTLLYGTTAVLGDSSDSIARCWLVDPPGDTTDNPRRFKIITRITYIADIISFLSKRSMLSAILQSRLRVLMALNDIMPLNSVPLKEDIQWPEYEPYPYTFSSPVAAAALSQGIRVQHDPWFANKSVIRDELGGGQIYLIDNDHMMFIGIREELIDYVTQQDFIKIERYKFPAVTKEKTIDCVVPAGRFSREFEPSIEIPTEDYSKRGGYVSFSLNGPLYYTQSGLIVGVLPIPKAWLKKQ